jgi:hypothetical protein
MQCTENSIAGQGLDSFQQFQLRFGDCKCEQERPDQVLIILIFTHLNVGVPLLERARPASSFKTISSSSNSEFQSARMTAPISIDAR